MAWLGVRRISGLYVWAALIIFFSLATKTFFTQSTWVTIGSEQAVTAIAAIGLTVPLAAGVFDLSIGGSMGVAAVASARMLHQLNPVTVVFLTLLIGMAIGVVNGLLVTLARIDPFIATLGMGSVLAAVVYIVSNNTNVLGVPVSFTNLASTQVGRIPLPVFYVIAMALIVWYILEWTPVGRRVYATGGSAEVARLAGVNTRRYIIGSFIASAGVASIAGMLVTARLGTGSPNVGPSYLLPAFAAGFLGATQFRPGRFNVWGTVIAVYLLATGVQGLVIMGAAFWTPNMFNGLALILAVGLTSVGRQARRKVQRRADSDPAVSDAPEKVAS